MSQTAIEKTKALKRIDLPITALRANTHNPNEMSDAEFNMLADNFERTGITDPILVRALEDGTYRIVGGHHRWEVAKLFDFEVVPCTIIDDPDFDEDAEKFQVVRMNVIRGKMNPAKFMQLYQGLSQKYTNEIAAELFGFVKQEEFDKLVAQMSKALPNEMQGEFKRAAKEIKTIDGLSRLMNSMFSKYGSTLPFNYMLIDFGGKDSVWLRMHGKERQNLLELGAECMKGGVTLDSVVAGAIKHLLVDAKTLSSLIAAGEKAEFPEGVAFPTEEEASKVIAAQAA